MIQSAFDIQLTHLVRIAAKTLSVIFHPLLLPTYAFLMIYRMNPLWFSAYSSAQLSQIFLIAIINTFLFPARLMMAS